MKKDSPLLFFLASVAIVASGFYLWQQFVFKDIVSHYESRLESEIAKY